MDVSVKERVLSFQGIWEKLRKLKIVYKISNLL